jgi:arginine deiminase
VPDAEYDSLGCNVLAVAPRRVVAASGNDETRRRLEAAGVEVHTYAAEELSKGDGGPTCLTCPLLRRS